jgi:hypothetical protein
MGGPEIAAGQLVSLVTFLADHPNAEIRILPLSHAALPAMLGYFTIFDLGDEENAVLYREGPLLDEIVQDPAVITRHRAVFEKAWAHSYSSEYTVHMLQTRAETMMESLDKSQDLAW